jgi:hypothetical protein
MVAKTSGVRNAPSPDPGATNAREPRPNRGPNGADQNTGRLIIGALLRYLREIASSSPLFLI